MGYIFMMQILPENIGNKSMDDVKGEEMLVRMFRQAISESAEASESEVSQIDRNWQYYWGRHYLRKVGNRYVPDTQGNDKLRIQRDVIQLSIDALRPILVKMYPEIMALASYPGTEAVIEFPGGDYTIPGLMNDDVASFLTKAKQVEDKRRYEEIRMAEKVLEVMIAGQCFETCIPVYREGYGTVLEPKVYPRAKVYLDPKGTRLADFRDFMYIAFEDEMDASMIYQNYGLREKDYVKSENPDENRRYNYEERGFFRSLTEFRHFGGRTFAETKYERRIYKVHTGYFNRYAAELQAYHGTAKKQNYPFGRQIVMINETKIAVDQPNPFEHGQYPIACLQSQPVPFIGRALSEIGKLIDTQRGTNLLVSALIGHTMMGMNPKVLYEEGAFNPLDWRGGPGGFVRVNRGSLGQHPTIQWYQPTPPDRGAYTLMKDMEYHAKEDVAGMTNSLSGGTPPAGTSGELYQTEQSAAMTGPTFKIQNLDAGVHRAAELEIELMQQYVDWQDPYYQITHDMAQYHPMMGEAVRDLYCRIIYESSAELPHNPIARHNFFWNQFVEGIIPFDDYLVKAKIQMSPEARQAAREGNLENYMPGVPREFRLQMMMEQIVAQQATEEAEAEMGGVDKSITQRRYALAGDEEFGRSNQIAGSTQDASL